VTHMPTDRTITVVVYINQDSPEDVAKYTASQGLTYERTIRLGLSLASGRLLPDKLAEGASLTGYSAETSKEKAERVKRKPQGA